MQMVYIDHLLTRYLNWVDPHDIQKDEQKVAQLLVKIKNTQEFLTGRINGRSFSSFTALSLIPAPLRLDCRLAFGQGESGFRSGFHRSVLIPPLRS